MKFVSIILIFIFSACDSKPHSSASIDSPNALESNVQVLELRHITWGAWLKPSDLEKGKHGGSLDSFVVYVEPANELLKLPEDTITKGFTFEFTGQFYKEKGFPKTEALIYSPKIQSKFDLIKKERLPSWVFRYTSYRITQRIPEDSESRVR